MKVAIIDSGINGSVFKNICIDQYHVKNGIISSEAVVDDTGHGTSMAGIILRQMTDNIEILSIRPIIEKGQLHNEDLAAAITFAVSQGVSIINISMGTEELKGRRCLDEACQCAFDKGIAVVCAFSKYNKVIMPWAAESVVKVLHGSENNGKILLKKSYFDSYMISVEKTAFRTVDYYGTPKIIMGHSAAAAFVTNKLCGCIQKHCCRGIEAVSFFLGEQNILEQELIYNEVSVIQGKIDELEKKESCFYGNAAVIPVSKEMDSLQTFAEYVSLKIIAGVDYRKKGRRESNIPIKSSLRDLTGLPLDWLIVGYLDKLEKIGDAWSLNYILEFALENRLHVFSFLPVAEEMKKRFAEKNLFLQDTFVYTNAYYERVNQAVPYKIPSKLPVLGVFGTSSRQGKFTLQMLLRRELERKKVKLITLATEHQAAAMDVSICYPCGYGGENNIKLSMEQSIELLQKSIYYLEQTTDAEMILVGGQSWLIPYHIEEQTAIYNLAFLEAVRPDCAIVVENPEVDPPEYISDTVQCLRSIYKTRVIALAFSDRYIRIKGNTVMRRKPTEEEKAKTAEQLQRTQNILAGCITDYNFIQQAVTRYLKIVEE